MNETVKASGRFRFSGRGFRPWLAPTIGLALAVLAALLPILNLNIPGVFPGPSYTPGTLQLLAYALLISALALTYHLLFGLAGMLSFGHALFFAAGAYGLGIILTQWSPPGVPAWAVFTLAIVITLVLGLVLAGVVGALSLRVSGISFAMVTLAFAQAGSVILGRNPGKVTGGSEGLPLATKNVPDIFIGVVNTAYLYWLSLALLVVVYLVTLLVERSRTGHTAAAARENGLRVEVLGMRSYWVRFAVFVVAAVLAVVCGMVFMLLQSGVTPDVSSSDFTLSLLVIVVLGGVGYRWGAIAGGIVYSLLDQRLGALASSKFVSDLPAVLRVPLSEPMFILGAVFILVVMFLPGGIAGLATRRGTRAIERSAPDAVGDASQDREPGT